MDLQAAREYREFEPTTSIVQEEDYDTILIFLPGFRKDQLRVQLTYGTLKISGERHTGDNKWIRFQKTYTVSTNSDTSKITAKFELKDDVGVLSIRQVKLIKPAIKDDEEKTENKNRTQSPLHQPPEMKNSSKPSGENMEGGDKVASKSDKLDDDNVAQKSQEEKEKELMKGGAGNDERGKGKRFYDFGNWKLGTSKVNMSKKSGTLSVVVIVLSAIVLGIYVKNLIMPVENYEN